MSFLFVRLLPGLLLFPEDEGDIFLWNSGWLLLDYTTLHPIRPCELLKPMTFPSSSQVGFTTVAGADGIMLKKILSCLFCCFICGTC
jgi:hypothetical protein